MSGSIARVRHAVVLAGAAWALPIQAQGVGPPAPGVQTRPAELVGVYANFIRGEPMGRYRQGVFCGPLGGKLEWQVEWQLEFDHASLWQIFERELRAAGFHSVHYAASVFQQPQASSEHLVAGFVEGMDLKLCFPYRSSGDRRTVSGSGTIRMKWEIFSKAENKVVASLATEGAGKEEDFVQGGDAQIFLGAFAENVRRLVATDAFRSAYTGPSTRPADPSVAPPPDALIDIASATRSVASIEDAVASTVLIFSDAKYGSGFLVSNDGYLLTNAHVVVGSKYVKVRWSDGAETLGEVVRSDRQRDVALIKAEARGRLPFKLRGTPVLVGEDVFAIGAPLDPQLQSTVTKGIVSSADRVFNGQRFIQSDVAVNPGSSGGPLVDKQSQLVALTVSGIETSGIPVGLNLFIPIVDASAAVGVRFSAAK